MRDQKRLWCSFCFFIFSASVSTSKAALQNLNPNYGVIIMNDTMYDAIMRICISAAQALAEGVDSNLTEDNIVEILCKGDTLYVLWEDGEKSGGYATIKMEDQELIHFATSFYGAKISYKKPQTNTSFGYQSTNQRWINVK